MKTPAQNSEWLFCYGILQDPAVQRANFGRKLAGHPDVLAGYALSYIPITDPAVIASSGLTRHKIIQPSSRIEDGIEGMVYQLTMDELAAADRYEVSECKRASVTMKSGLRAWAYIRA
jgi:hypothetical protein